jgi:hypothetical protein
MPKLGHNQFGGPLRTLSPYPFPQPRAIVAEHASAACLWMSDTSLKAADIPNIYPTKMMPIERENEVLSMKIRTTAARRDKAGGRSRTVCRCVGSDTARQLPPEIQAYVERRIEIELFKKADGALVELPMTHATSSALSPPNRQKAQPFGPLKLGGVLR